METWEINNKRFLKKEDVNLSNHLNYSEKFIAFIDILGFKQMVTDSISGQGKDLAEILEIMKLLGSQERKAYYHDSPLPPICPHSQCIQPHMDFEITQISDCVILSCEISEAGAINMINECHKIAMRLLRRSILCRGYITKGTVYHKDMTILGTGYQDAYHHEEEEITAFHESLDEKGTPFIEIAPSFKSFIESCDNTVQILFKRMTKTDGSVTAIFPFSQLESTIITGSYMGFEHDLVDQKKENLELLAWLQQVISLLDFSTEKASAKTKYYHRFLKETIETAQEVDQMLAQQILQKALDDF